MIAHKICPDYIHEVYEYQTEIALEKTLPFGTPGKLYKIISIYLKKFPITQDFTLCYGKYIKKYTDYPKKRQTDSVKNYIIVDRLRTTGGKVWRTFMK